MRIANLFQLRLPVVSPSLLAARQDELLSESERAIEAGASMLHFDVMDGSFVPNRSFFGNELDEVLPKVPCFRDVHLMVDDPVEAARKYLALGADAITVHVEALEERGVKPSELRLLIKAPYVGISLRPGTDVGRLLPFLPYVDLILVMSVEPGKGGQKFMEGMLEKARFLASYRASSKLSYLVSIDGGINAETSKKALGSGVDILVAGSYLFGHSDFASRLRGLIDG